MPTLDEYYNWDRKSPERFVGLPLHKGVVFAVLHDLGAILGHDPFDDLAQDERHRALMACTIGAIEALDRR